MMTKWIFTILLTCSYWISSAQYFPFPQSDAIWEGSFVGFIGEPQKQYFVLCGDSTLNNEQYNKLYAVYTDTLGNVIEQNFMTGIREDGNKKIWADSGEGAILLYDFNLEPGDTFDAAIFFDQTFINTIEVESIGETEVGGEMRRTIFFEQDVPFRQEFWIEGIGSNYNLLDRGLNLGDIVDYEPYLECFRKNNDLLLNLFPGESVCTFEYDAGSNCTISTGTQDILKSPLTFEVYPNPAQNYFNLKIVGESSSSLVFKLYNVFGDELMQISPIVAKQEDIAIGYLSPGIYFLQLFDPTKNTQIAIQKLVVQR